jgi:hypothetical protein
MTGHVLRAKPIPLHQIDLDWLQGRRLEQVSFSPPTLWRFSFGGGGVLAVETLWRLISGAALVVTSEDHGQQYGLPDRIDATTRVMNRRPLTVVQLLRGPAGADLIIRFKEGAELQVIATSSGYESWQVESPDGRCFAALGSGTASTWDRG